MSSFSPRIDNLERNHVINGGADIWQRGTSFATTTGANTYNADRFLTTGFSGSSSSFTVTQSTDVPTLAQSGFQSRYSILATMTSASSTSAPAIQYKMEGQDYAAIHGKNSRVQFWVKSSGSGTYTLSLRNSSNNRSYVMTYSIPSSNVWQKVALDLQMDTAGTWSFDNTLGLTLNWFWGPGDGSQQTSTFNTWKSDNNVIANTQANQSSNNGGTFQITQVMLISTDLVTGGATNADIPFQRHGKDIGEEIRSCQRYYEKSYAQGDAPGSTTQAGRRTVSWSTVSSNLVGTFVQFMVPKRVQNTYTATVYGPTSGNTAKVLGLAASLGSNGERTATTTGLSEMGFEIQATAASDTAITYQFAVDADF